MASQSDARAHNREDSDTENPNTGTPKTTFHITQDGEYFAKENDKWYEVELSYLGTPIIGDRPTNEPANLDSSPPAKWGEGYKSNKRMEYPLPDEYTLDGKTELDKTEVKHLTKALQKAENKRRRLAGPENWEKRFRRPLAIGQTS
eukprot:scaffold308278_cov30-Tisochrysis_lutea.AAC.1